MPAEQGKRTDLELSRNSAKFPEHQRLSEFRKLAEIPIETFRRRLQAEANVPDDEFEK